MSQKSTLPQHENFPVAFNAARDLSIRALNLESRFARNRLFTLFSADCYRSRSEQNLEMWLARFVDDEDDGPNRDISSLIIDDLSSPIAHLCLCSYLAERRVELAFPFLHRSYSARVFSLAGMLWEKTRSIAARGGAELIFHYASAADRRQQLLSVKCFDAQPVTFLPRRTGLVHRQHLVLMYSMLSRPPEARPVFVADRDRPLVELIFSALRIPIRFFDPGEKYSAPGTPRAAVPGPAAGCYYLPSAVLDFEHLAVWPSQVEALDDLAAVEKEGYMLAALQDPRTPDFADLLRQHAWALCGVLPLASGADYLVFADRRNLGGIQPYGKTAAALYAAARASEV